MSGDNGRAKEGQGVLTPAGARPRRSTLETFNEELAVLDRPIEGDVEYYDELPPKRRSWLRPVGVALVAIIGGGFLALSGHQRGALPLLRSVQAVSPASAPIAGAGAASRPTSSVPTFTATAPSAPAIAPVVTPALAIATPPTATRTESPAEKDEVPAHTSSPAPPAVWAKNLHLAGQHPKHGRSTGGRSSGRSGRRRG